MYIPANFQETDRTKLFNFMERHSFATLVSQQYHNLVASHLPLLLDRAVEPRGRLIGHMARANSQWQTAADQRVLVIFHGPHAYISPSWYDARNVVPTWNYVTVHAYGTLRLIEDHDRLHDIVQRTVQRYESTRPQPWSMDGPEPEFLDKLLTAIVGFEIDIERLEGKWKLNQNHSAERQANVIRGLREANEHDERQIAEWMEATEAK